MIRSGLLIFLLGCFVTAAAAQTTNHSILVVGDSISAAHGISPDQGWVQLLATKITQEKFAYQVINSSISGDTTIGGLNRLADLLNRYQPEIIILELGGNDGLRGLSIKTLENNLRQMIGLAKRANAQILLAGMKIPPNYGKRYTEAFHQVYFKLAKSEQVFLIPFLLEGVGEKAELMQADGIHPTAEAQPIMMQTVWKNLQPLLKRP